MSNNNMSRSTLIHRFSSVSEVTCIYSFILFACWNAYGTYQMIKLTAIREAQILSPVENLVFGFYFRLTYCNMTEN